jgi:hypothetical protein
MRTIGLLALRYKQFIESGGKKKDANKHANVIHPCLIKEDPSKLILDQLPPPELHLLIGVVNKLMDLLIAQVGLEWTEHWTKSHHIIRHGYSGGGYDGKNSKKILECLDDLSNQVPLICLPIIDVLRSFHPIVTGCHQYSCGL